MNFDQHLIAGSIPLGGALSMFTSILKAMFDLEGRRARKIVFGFAAIYLIGITVAKSASETGDLLMGVVNGLSSGIALICGSEGFYAYVTKELGWELKLKEDN